MTIALFLIVFGSLAAFALWACWHDEDIRLVGIALTISFLTSNILWFSGATGARAGVYTMLEVIVAVSAYTAWTVAGDKRLTLVVVFATLSVCGNVAFAALHVPTPHQKFVHEIVSNLCFAAECLATAWVGIRHGVGVGRFNRGIVSNGSAAAEHVAEGQAEP